MSSARDVRHVKVELRGQDPLGTAGNLPVLVVNGLVKLVMTRFLPVLLLLLTVDMWAQAKGQSQASPRPTVPIAESGTISAGVYRNAAFGFSYKLPFGWVDRSAEMQDDTAGASKSRVLLANFERPPEAPGDTMNSAIVIAAEPLLAGPKTAREYFASVSALISAKGFQAEGEPHEFLIGASRLVRGDFSKSRGAGTVRQTSLVLSQKGYGVSLTSSAEAWMK